MSTIKEAELFPISRKNLDATRRQLAVSSILEGGSFDRIGMFRVLDTILRNDRMPSSYSGSIMWSPELLGLDAESLKLRANRAGNVIVMDVQGNPVKTIYPFQVREVDRVRGGYQRVGESGYLLPLGKEIVGSEVIKAANLEELLTQAEKGVRPGSEFIDDRYFAVKVDPNLKGRELFRLDFILYYSDPKWVTDAVVIDLQTNQLVPRKIYHSFAPHRWERSLINPVP